MADVLRVAKSQAISLFEAMGLSTAKKWSLKKLTEKINEIETEPDEPLDDEEMESLLDDLLNSAEAVVVEDGDFETDSDNDTDDDDADEEQEQEEEAEDDDEEEEEPPTKTKKAKGKAKAKGKDKAKGKAKAKTGRSRENSIDAVTIAILTAKPMKLDALVAKLVKQFPDRDPEALERTTKRRLSGYLQARHNVEINKSEKGIYSIEAA